MTRAPLPLTVAALATSAFAQTSADADRQAIEAVVRTAYVDGVHAKPSAALMRQGFHPDFRMYVLRDGALSTLTLEDWAARSEKGAAERKGPPAEIKADFTRVDVTGSAAAVQLQLYRDGQHTFTDFLSLYRFPDGWKIVAKTFYNHPR